MQQSACRLSGIVSCPMILVFGCRQSEVDHIYKEETIQAKNKEVFKELYAAYSREPDKPKVGALNHPLLWASEMITALFKIKSHGLEMAQCKLLSLAVLG